MKATVVRQGTHQGITFVEVREVNAQGLQSPITYSVPGNYPVGTELDILVTEVESAEEKQATEDAKAEAEFKTKAAEGE